MDEIQHFSHKHALKRFLVLAGRDKYLMVSESSEHSDVVGFQPCRLCDRLEFPGQTCYGCLDCCYSIHKDCSELPIRMYFHPLHARDHSLTLSKRSLPAATCCYYCDGSFANDECYTYGCDDCSNLYMHMACAAIPLPTISTALSSASGVDRVARFDCHQHPMTLVPDQRRQGQCFACQSNWLGPAYCCASKDVDCGIFLHKSCAEIPERIRHSLDSRHCLELQVSKPRTCDLCDKKGCRLVYCCNEDGCRINLCVKCASFVAVKCLSHDHELWLMEKPSWTIYCEGCRKSYTKWVDFRSTVEVKSTQSYLFRCLKCYFDFHFLCGPLPTSVKYEFHIHRLSLVDHSSIDDDSDEFYCDACEQERDSFFRVYYCKECKYVAHIHCVISEIMKEIKGFTKDMEFRALGESRWEFGIETEKEKQDDATVHLTMSHIMTRLTEQEWKIFRYPFNCEDADYDSRRTASHKQYQQLNSRFDSRGKSVEDIGRIQQLFSFGSDEFANLCHELHLFSPPQGVTIDKKFLRQKVEDVDGYMVPKTLVPILKTLLHKYGHLGGKSNLTPNMKSVVSTLLCIVIDEMCRTMVQDITKDDLKNWYFYLYAIKKFSGFEIIELGSFDNFLLPTFLGFEVTRQEKDVGEKLDLEIATLEDKLMRYEGNRKKLIEYASEKSDFIKECIGKASEWKGKFLGDKWF